MEGGVATRLLVLEPLGREFLLTCSVNGATFQVLTLERPEKGPGSTIRLDSLAYQLPGAVEFYLHKGFVAQALEDDFNPIDYLHQQTGALVDVWTFNSSDEGLARELKLSLAAGADQITTGTAIQLAEFWEGAKAG